MLHRFKIVILLTSIFCLPSFANEPLPLIEVSAYGSAKSAPDQAEILLTFSKSSLEIDDARVYVDKHVATFLVELESFELESQSLDSSQVNISPVYDYSKKQRTLRAYQVSRDINFKLNNLDQLQKMITLLSVSKVAKLEKIEFGLSDMSILKEEALTKALENAKHLAQHIARTYEVNLGSVYKVHHQTNQSSPVMMRSMALQEMSSSENSSYVQKALEYKATINAAFHIN